jgi:hypothetical protein
VWIRKKCVLKGPGCFGSPVEDLKELVQMDPKKDFAEATRLCLKSQEIFLEEVSTTCGSGWVNDQNAILLVILGANG